MMDFSWHVRAQNSIAQSYLTNSKRPECHVKGIYPTHLKRGQGCYVWDHQDKRYMDFICGLGTNIIGYSNETVIAAIASQMQQGASLSFASTIEVETAEKLKELFPFVDCVKFLKTGSDVCSAAIKIARTKTDRSIVLSDGYHGHHDAFVGLTPPALGIPDVILKTVQTPAIMPLDVNQIDSSVAAVIIEPIITDHSRARIEWLKELREKCTKHGVMLIFDEVITGFRFPKYSVSRYYGIEPDLICLGKAIANGMPLAAVGGKYATMNCDEYFVSSTYAGETLSLASAKSTMSLLQNKYSIDDLWLRGQDFLDRFNRMWPGTIWIEGYPSRGSFKGDVTQKALFFQEACKAGILFGPSWFFNFDLAENYPSIMGTLQDIITRIKNGQVKLEGEMPKAAFADRVRART